VAKIIDFKFEKNRRNQNNGQQEISESAAFRVEKSVDILVEAIDRRQSLVVFPCVDTRTNKTVMALCTPYEVSKGEFVMLPLVQLFEENPLDFLKPTPLVSTSSK
jgi:hypothetical protein